VSVAALSAPCDDAPAPRGLSGCVELQASITAETVVSGGFKGLTAGLGTHAQFLAARGVVARAGSRAESTVTAIRTEQLSMVMTPVVGVEIAGTGEAPREIGVGSNRRV
jgi:hypothetical protein